MIVLDVHDIAIAAPAAFLAGVIVGWFSRYQLVKNRNGRDERNHAG